MVSGTVMDPRWHSDLTLWPQYSIIRSTCQIWPYCFGKDQEVVHAYSLGEMLGSNRHHNFNCKQCIQGDADYKIISFLFAKATITCMRPIKRPFATQGARCLLASKDWHCWSHAGSLWGKALPWQTARLHSILADVIIWMRQNRYIFTASHQLREEFKACSQGILEECSYTYSLSHNHRGSTDCFLGWRLSLPLQRRFWWGSFWDCSLWSRGWETADISMDKVIEVERCTCSAKTCSSKQTIAHANKDLVTAESSGVLRHRASLCAMQINAWNEKQFDYWECC